MLCTLTALNIIGHQGLSSLCGHRLEQLAARLGRCPTYDEWLYNMADDPLHKSFATSSNGKHMMLPLLESTELGAECRRFASFLSALDLSFFPLSVEPTEPLRRDAIQRLVLSGLLRYADPRMEEAVEWMCPLAAALVRYETRRTGVPCWM